MRSRYLQTDVKPGPQRRQKLPRFLGMIENKTCGDKIRNETFWENLDIRQVEEYEAKREGRNRIRRPRKTRPTIPQRRGQISGGGDVVHSLNPPYRTPTQGSHTREARSPLTRPALPYPSGGVT